MRYRLRTLLIALTLMPPLLAGTWRLWPKTEEQPTKPSFGALIDLILATVHPDSWDDVGGPGAIDEFSTGCVLIVVADENYDGPDSCGRGYSFTPYSEYENVDNVETSSALPSTAMTEDPFEL